MSSLSSFALAAAAILLSPPSAWTEPADSADPLFAGDVVPHLNLEISAEGLNVLRQYRQVWGQPRPERVDVQITVREGDRVYTNVTAHLKGSFSFQPIDQKPSLTLNFDKFAPGQLFHGLSKIHLNNSAQDPSYLCEAVARHLFSEANIPSPRAGHAMTSLNGKDLGCYVLIEGANKRWLKRHFGATRGNLYDGGSGGDITKPLKVDSGDSPEDRSDLAALVAAAREPDLSLRLQRLEKAMDLDRFLSFAALEIIMTHWDGYSIGANNYRVFHDTSRDKLIFLPHGLDQLFGIGTSISLNLTPHLNGLVARAVLSLPEVRVRYLERVNQMLVLLFESDDAKHYIDERAQKLRREFAADKSGRAEFNRAVANLKQRMAARIANVREQLAHPEHPLAFAPGGFVSLSGWYFKTGLERPASGQRATQNGRQILQVQARGATSSGSWRTLALLEAGHYEFTGLGRTANLGVTATATNTGVLLRVSGERSPKGLSTNETWTDLRYEFDIRGIENTELVCEFRGREGLGWFDPASLKLKRIGPAGKQK